MNRTRIRPFLICLLAMAGALAGPLQGQSITARAQVSPEVIMAGSQAEYIISFTNTTRLPNITTPRVDGLAFSDSMGTSTFQQIINGRASLETRASWAFQATREGTFTIPGREVVIEGQRVQIPSVSFEVVPMDEEMRTRAFLQVDLPEGPFTVGQAIPAKVGVFFRSDISPANISFPERIGEAFINSEFSNTPQRTRVRVSGRLYEAFVWEILLTPIKSGPAELGFSQVVSLQVTDPNDRFPSIFNLSRSRVENVTLQSEVRETEILPLPTEDQPAAFRDAIGRFAITAQLSSRDLQVGEPLTLTITFEGTGNFDRIAPPELPEWEGWRLYPPKVEFSPTDALGLTGRKSFAYILMPLDSALTEVPEIQLASFDPETRTYSTTVLEAEPVTVRPAPTSPDPEPFFAREDTRGASASRIPDALLPIRPEAGRLLPAHQPLWQQTGYWIANGTLALALLGAIAWQDRRRRLSEDTHLARRHLGGRRVRKALQAAREAARAGDAETFFANGRAALQERISHLSAKPVEARTLVTSDCLSLLQGSPVPPEMADRCMAFLQEADACHFAGLKPEPASLPARADELLTTLTDLNRYLK